MTLVNCTLIARQPSAFQAGHIPSWHGSCGRCALSPVVAACRWWLLLLSPLLSAQPWSSGGNLTRTVGRLGRTCSHRLLPLDRKLMPLLAAQADDPVHEPVHARASAPVILLLCVIPLRTLHPRTRAGPARHELTVFRIAVKYSSRAMSGAGVRRSHHPRPQRDELPGRAGPRLTIRGMSALRWRANVSHARGLSARDTC